jgi:hypothetical protein
MGWVVGRTSVVGIRWQGRLAVFRWNFGTLRLAHMRAAMLALRASGNLRWTFRRQSRDGAGASANFRVSAVHVRADEAGGELPQR